MPVVTYGTMPDGTGIEKVGISAGDLAVEIINYGAVIHDVRLAGIDHPLVLGCDTLDDYISHSPYFGAVPGRSANRIAGGHLEIDGKSYQLSLNENGVTHLHGGFHGFGKRAWRLVGHDATSVTLAVTSEDGDDGYPGRVEATVIYTVEAPGTLRFEAEATTDAPTVVNLTQHSYFNLDDSAEVLDHHVEIHADAYTPVDARLIPTGEIRPVADTEYDFRQPRPIRLAIDGARVPYDTNFVLGMEPVAEPRLAARLRSPKNGVTLSVSTTDPGLQFYDGNNMKASTPGLGGRRYQRHGGCCFEAQFFPDAPNQANFPSTILRPGETYRQTTLFAFAGP